MSVFPEPMSALFLSTLSAPCIGGRFLGVGHHYHRHSHSLAGVAPADSHSTSCQAEPLAQCRTLTLTAPSQPAPCPGVARCGSRHPLAQCEETPDRNETPECRARARAQRPALSVGARLQASVEVPGGGAGALLPEAIQGPSALPTGHQGPRTQSPLLGRWVL